METQEKNVSLALSELSIEKEMRNIVNVFYDFENYSYTICFLGSRNDTIFEEKKGQKSPIKKEEVEYIVAMIFSQFEQSDIHKALKIITNGAMGGGIPKIVSEKFCELREIKSKTLKKKGKHIQIIGVVTYDEKEINECYDYYIRVESVSAQIQAMMNMSNLFIGLPGQTSTNLSTVIESMPGQARKLEYRVLLHSYWEKKFAKEIEQKKVSILDMSKDKYLEQVPLKENTPTRQTEAGLEGLKRAILDCLNKGLAKDDKLYDENALLTINLDYSIEDERNVERFYSYYAEENYSEFSFFASDIFYSLDNNDDIYGFTILPNGKLKKEVSLKHFENLLNKKNILADIPIETIKEPHILKKYRDVIAFTEEYRKLIVHSVPIYDSFRKMVRFLDEKQYGQTLMWRYKKIGYGYDFLKFSLVVIFNYQLPMVKVNTIKRLIEDFLSNFSAEKMGEVFGKKNDLLLRQATESAIGKVFVRNMSHNIISHVLVHLQKKENLTREGIENLIQKDNAYIGSFKLPWEENGRPIEDKDRESQMALILSYIADRSYYLNEATYGVANTLGMKRFYNDIFRELDLNRILLNNISGIDNYKYKLNFVDERDEVLNEDNDISVMLPGDTLGQQAFYNIIENIIRNEAKHGGTKQGTVNFYIKISDIKNDDFYNEKEKKEYLKITIYSDATKISIGDMVSIQRKIDSLVFDRKYKLRSHSLGLLEMKVSTAFLRQRELTSIDDKRNIPQSLPLLSACGVNGCLGYEFYVKKPEKYIFVLEEDNFLEEKNIESLENYGISFLKVEEFKKSIEEGKVYSYEFIFLQEEVQDKLGELGECFYKTHNDKQTNRKKGKRVEALSLLPERLMLIEKDFAKKLIDSKDIEAFEKKVWEQWEGEKVEEINKNTTKVNQDIYRDNIGETGNGFNYDECRQVVFFDHLNNYDTWKNLTAGVNTSLVTIEPLSSAAQRKLPEFKNNLNEYIRVARKSPICQKLVEAYFNKVIVIDERIQRVAESFYPAKNGQGVKEAEIFNYINVLIPEKEKIDLAKEHFSNDDKNAIIAYIDDIEKAEFLVIHYGILERIYNNAPNRTEAINKQLNKWVKVTRVIVTSGRGRQTLEHLPLSVNYLNISSLLYAFVENRNKYSINYILNQSRR
jgi:hypothetical protein